MSGKGDTPRPVNREKYNENFDRIFRSHNGKFKGNSDKPRDVSLHSEKESWRGGQVQDKP